MPVSGEHTGGMWCRGAALTTGLTLGSSSALLPLQLAPESGVLTLSVLLWLCRSTG